MPSQPRNGRHFAERATFISIWERKMKRTTSAPSTCMNGLRRTRASQATGVIRLFLKKAPVWKKQRTGMVRWPPFIECWKIKRDRIDRRNFFGFTVQDSMQPDSWKTMPNGNRPLLSTKNSLLPEERAVMKPKRGLVVCVWSIFSGKTNLPDLSSDFV